MRTRGSLAAGFIVGVSLIVVVAGVVASVVVFHSVLRRADLAAHAIAAGDAAAKKGPLVGVITNDIASFDQAIGAHANLTVKYLAWGKPIGEDVIMADAAEKTQVMISLEPRNARLRDIVAGKYDTYLRNTAVRIKNAHADILMSFGPEMNGSWYSWGSRKVTPQLFVAAYRHVHDVISSIAGSYITWVWQVSHLYAGSAALKPLYPGARYVQMVGIDGYFEQPTDDFSSIFGRTVRYLRGHVTKNTPIFISETAVGNLAGKKQKMPELFAGIKRLKLRGMVWFEQRQHGGVHKQNWLIEGDPAAMAAFRAGLRLMGVKVRRA